MSTIKFDYVFLDYDGPVLDGKPKHYHCYKDIIEEGGGVPLPCDEYWALKRAKTSRTVILEKSHYKKSYDDFLSHWIDRIERPEYLQYDRLKPNVEDVLKEIKLYTGQLYLVTMRNNIDTLQGQLENLNIDHLFDKVVTCSSINNERKYDYLKNIAFDRALMIGDTEEETETAKKLGIECIAITNGIREKQFLKADYYAEELQDIHWEKIG